MEIHVWEIPSAIIEIALEKPEEVGILPYPPISSPISTPSSDHQDYALGCGYSELLSWTAFELVGLGIREEHFDETC